MPEAPKVMLVDDHDLFRAGLRTLLEKEGVRVVADCRGERNCFELARRANPTVLLMDVAAASGTGMELAASFGERFPEIRVMMLTLSEQDLDIYLSIRAGARGYMSKSTPTPELVTAINAVHAGDGCLSPTIAGKVLSFVRTGRIPRSLDSGMSDREIDVLRLIASGFDNNQIAAELNISAKTVKNHISSIFEKLDMNNRVQAAVYAVRSGLA